MKKLFVILMALVFVPLVSAALSDDIISYYNLDGSSGPVIDSIGNNNGTNDGATRGVTGKLSDAFFFERLTDDVNISNDGSATYNFSSFTLTAWVNFSSLTGSFGTQYLVGRETPGGADSNRPFSLRASNTADNMLIAVTKSDSSEHSAASTIINIDEWYFVSATYNNNSGDLNLYINGELNSSTNTGAGLLKNAHLKEFYLGNNIQSMNGTLDEVGIWSRELSLSEIQALYNGGDGITYPFGDLSVLLDSPADESSISDVGTNFTASYESQGLFNLTNATYNVWLSSTGALINQTTVSISGTTNETTLFIDDFSVSDLLWNVEACANNLTHTMCAFAANNFTLSVSSIINQVNWTNVTEETSQETFLLNITKFPGSTVQATLFYNDSSFVATKSESGDNVVFLRTITIPIVDANVQKEFWWEVATTSDLGTSTFTTENYTQTVLNTSILNSGSTVAINYTIFDEELLTQVNADLDITFEWFFGDGSITENSSFSESGASQYKFYIDPDNITYTVDSSLNVNNQPSTLLERTFDFNNEEFNNITIERALYLPNQTNSRDVTIEFVDQGLQPLPNHFITIERFYPGDGLFRMVESRETNTYGQISARLVEGLVRYRFRFYNPDNELLKEEDNVIVRCDNTLICVVSFIQEDQTDYFERFDDIDNYAASLAFNNNTNVFTFSWTDSRDVPGTNRMVVERILFNGTTTVCDETSTTTVSSMTCSVGDQDATYRAQSFTTVSGDYRRLEVLNVKVDNDYQLFGMEGLFWAFLLLFILISIGIFSPPIAIVLYLVGFALLGFLDIIFINPIILIANLVIGVLFIWAFRN